MTQMGMSPYSPTNTMLPYLNLESSFSIYLNEPQKLLDTAIRESIDEYLLCLRFFCEAKKIDRSLSNTSQIYPRLIQLMMQNKYSHKSTLACLVHSLQAYDIQTPCFEHISALLYKGKKTNKVP